jgi:23S rRNA (adenine2503-C2)-methyltransferase
MAGVCDGPQGATIGSETVISAVETFLTEIGEPRYRARQVAEAKRHGALGWEGVTSWPKALRELVVESVPLWSVTPEATARSTDHTVKWALRAADGARIETVSIAHANDRRTVCVSSQVGCALGCRFCATAKLGAGRNLSDEEILDQVVFAAAAAEADDARVSNVVFMGMGEPLQNLQSVMSAAEQICHPDGLGLSTRKVAISTAGWVPGIDELSRHPLQVRLAISLHASNDETRSALMPINNRWPIANLLAACRRYCDTTGRRVFIEYLLLHEVNDSVADAGRLANLLRDGNFHVNIIEYNPTEGPYRGSSSTRRETFIAALDRAGVTPSVRRSRGADIDAACGQLALKGTADPA